MSFHPHRLRSQIVKNSLDWCFKTKLRSETKTVNSVGKCIKKLLDGYGEALAAQSCFYSGGSGENKLIQTTKTLQSWSLVLKYAKFTSTSFLIIMSLACHWTPKNRKSASCDVTKGRRYLWALAHVGPDTPRVGVHPPVAAAKDVESSISFIS